MNYVRITLINFESREEFEIGDFITEKYRTKAIDDAINTIWKDTISAVLGTDDLPIAGEPCKKGTTLALIRLGSID